jgi:plasmid stabilization system protein ParE
VKPLPVVALDAVQEDLQAAYDYFEERVARTGDRFLARYFATADCIGRNCETFPVKFDDYRRALIPKSNLAVYYFVEADRVVIAAVIDARRDPALIRRLVRRRE